MKTRIIDRIRAWRIPLLFAAVTVLAYGLLLPFTGFYWDDWPFAWLAKFMGPSEFIPAFRGFRPFLGPIFYVTTSLVPIDPLLWQIFSLLIRFASGLAAWWALSQVWPRHRGQVLVAALLFLVFPGYSQHWVALTHINQEWIPLIFYLLSFAFTARALRRFLPEIKGDDPNAPKKTAAAAVSAGSPPAPLTHTAASAAPPPKVGTGERFNNTLARHLGEGREGVDGAGSEVLLDPPSKAGLRPRATRFQRAASHPLTNTALALLFLIAGLFPTEYFIGLEPLRFFFIWVIVSERETEFSRRLVQSLKRWWPYVLVWLADAAWLAYYYKSGVYVSYDVTAAQSAPRLGEAVSAFGDALWKAGLYVWFQVLILAGRSISTPTSLLTLALIIISFVLAAFYFLRSHAFEREGRGFALPAILIGLVGILFGRVPSFAASLPLTLQSSYDRFMISMMLGASLFAVGMVELLVRSNRVKTGIFALLIALAVGQQFFNANIFRRDWARQQQIYWQMAWRMPALQTGTVIVTQQMPLDYETDFSMTAALNWIYSSQPRPATLPYALIYDEKRLGGGVLPSLEIGTAIRFPFRTLEFVGSTSQLVAIYVPPDGCLRVLDPSLGDAQTYSKFAPSLTEPIPLSDPSRILIDTPSPVLPLSPFGAEPEHDWCYLYEKAELARQAKDWKKIVELAAQANLGGFTPQDPFEWLPFIEGYARTDHLPSAVDLTHKAWDEEPKLHRGLCVLWRRLQKDGPPATQSTAATILGQFECGQ